LSVVPAVSNALLQGTYVFSVQGENGSGSYTAAGTVVADGNGVITGGEQDYADESVQAGPDALTGAYAIGPDGRGSLVLDANNTHLSQDGLETFSIVVITQFDGTATSSGSLDLQAASALDPAAIGGAFAFTAGGTDVLGRVPIGRGGVLTLSASSGLVTGGTYFENDGGATFSASVTGSLTSPDAFGRGTLTLDAGVSFVYYAVQGKVLRLVESGFPAFVTGGSAYGQGAAGLNAAFSTSSLAGDYVLTGAGGTAHGALALAGLFTADGTGNFPAGQTDLNNAGRVTAASIAGPARYAVSGDGVGTLDLPPAVDQLASVSALRFFLVDPDINLFDPGSPTGGGGALLLDFDTGAVASGQIVPRSGGDLAGSYALNFQFVDNAGETDWVGRAVAGAGTWTGEVDVNETGLIAAAEALAGTFAADTAAPGRLTGTLTARGLTHQVVFYQISGSRLIFVDADGSDIGIGIIEKD
jgi:hypothetical protein